jgi:UDP-GlcNAc:undecaprenyl-phosphate GlcNAc-1-phosphate transferase
VLLYSLYLCGLAFLLSACLSFVVRGVSLRAAAFDTAPLPGQVKAAARRVPNTGGIAIFGALVLPLCAAIAGVHWFPSFIESSFPAAAQHLEGVRAQTPLALLLVTCLLMLHVLGLIDDRRPLGPWIKLVIMVLPAAAMATVGETRLFTAADTFTGTPIVSVILTILWFVIVTNAMNFIDNMDGLCAGVAAVAGSLFLIGAIISGQWFVAGTLALLVGACGGFLVFNRPPASLFMGDGGSLVIGFTLAFLTVRGTYIPAASTSSGLDGSSWYGVLTPLVVLAVPLYDFTTVTLIRLRAGRSPFVGDLNHLSHRLTRRGLSKPGAVACILLITAATGVGGLLLRDANPTNALLIGLQVVCILLVVARLEFMNTSST